jgi:sigma-70-like protein
MKTSWPMSEGPEGESLEVYWTVSSLYRASAKTWPAWRARVRALGAMINDALRRQALHDGSAAEMRASVERASVEHDAGARVSPWRGEPEALTLVLDGSEVDALVAEAARWAERITLCVTAPQSDRGRLPFWGELLARSSKCDRVYVRRAELAEGWLLHRLHDTGALRLVDGGGKQVASNLLVFARGAERRVLFSHIPLERAVDGVAFGTLLSCVGASDGTMARACATQADAWGQQGRIPTGGDIDRIAHAARPAPAARSSLPRSPRVVADPAELDARLATFAAALALESAASAGSAQRCTASVRDLSGSFRVVLEQRGRAPFVLTLFAGADWAAGNALLLDASDGSSVLVWRGGLLGSSRSKNELLWSEAALESLTIEDAGLGLLQRVALIAHTASPLLPQLTAFASEMTRLGEVFAVEPPPTLGHALTEFAELPAKKQTLFLYKALLGQGPLEPSRAAAIAAEVLRDQGYLRGQRLEPGSSALAGIAELIDKAASAGASFDRPSPDTVRAIQPDLAAYTVDDWLDCLLRALPEAGKVPRSAALRLAFDRARRDWGLSRERLQAHGHVERALEKALACALRRGLLLRVGADGLARNRAEAHASGSIPAPGGANDSFISGFERALDRLTPVERLILTRRAGWYARRESVESVAQRLGLTPERARQLEAEAWQKIESATGWLSTLAARLDRALAGARAVPVRRLALDDAWWRGAERHLDLAEAAFEASLPNVHRIELELPERREAFFARFAAAELEHAVAALRERAAAIPTPARLEQYLALCAAAAAELDPGLAEQLRDALEAQLELDPDQPERVLGWSPQELAPIQTLPSDRSVDSEALLRLEDVLRSVFRSAGTPLPFESVAERVRQRVDVDDTVLAERLARAPFVRRNADQYGLLTRDVPGGPEAIASALNAVTGALAATERSLAAEPLASLVQASVSQPWSADLTRSVIGSDPALSLSATHEVTLRRWEHARLPETELLCPSLPAPLRPRFAKLVQAPLQASDKLSQRLRSELDRLERAGDLDDYASVPLARSLSDLIERLLEHAASAPLPSQQLAQATAAFFLEAVAPDEDDFEAAVDRDKLVQARAVLATVLRWLELDWLDGERLS